MTKDTREAAALYCVALIAGLALGIGMAAWL